jgi:lipooligosaccharide transport system ATP-binding protein
MHTGGPVLTTAAATRSGDWARRQPLRREDVVDRRATTTGTFTAGPTHVGVDARPDATGAPAPPAIEVSQVVKAFGDLRALDRLDLVVPQSGTFGLLGPNGAGKSTLMRLLTGTAVATSGSVDVLGLPMPEASLEIRTHTGFVPQADNLDNELTCAENLTVYARLYGVAPSERADAVAAGLAFARLSDRADTVTEHLSGGMRRRLLIARGLLHRPDLVLLDEPTVGLDPQIRQELWNQIDAIRSSGATVVLTTHYIEEAERLCDEVAIIDPRSAAGAGPPGSAHCPPRR